MNSPFTDTNTPTTPGNLTVEKSIKISKNQLIRQSTTPSQFGTPPKTNELHRQMSASPSLSTPVSAISAYIRNLFGLNQQITKRSLSEEAECGSPESISEWLRQGSSPNEIDAYGYTPLVNACLRGCIKSAKILINNGADINMHAMHGYCPLHAAAQNGYVELVEFLLDNGADIEVKNDDQDTPLMLAVRSEHAAVVDVLCKRGCNMHTQGFDHIEPIDYAINKRNLYMSDVLMRHERQNLSSTSSLINVDQSTAVNNNNFNHSISEELKSSESITSLLQKEQIIHSNKQDQSLNDSVFQSD